MMLVWLDDVHSLHDASLVCATNVAAMFAHAKDYLIKNDDRFNCFCKLVNDCRCISRDKNQVFQQNMGLMDQLESKRNEIFIVLFEKLISFFF